MWPTPRKKYRTVSLFQRVPSTHTESQQNNTLWNFYHHRLVFSFVCPWTSSKHNHTKCAVSWLVSSASVQFSSVAQSCPTLCDPMNRSTPGLPVHHQLPEFTQIHVPRVSDALQPSHPLSSPSPPAPNPYQHQSLFQWVNSSHEVAKVLEFQL